MVEKRGTENSLYMVILSIVIEFRKFCFIYFLLTYSFICLYVCLFIYLFIYSFIYLFVYLFICLFIYSFIYLFIYLLFYLFNCFFVCLFCKHSFLIAGIKYHEGN